MAIGRETTERIRNLLKDHPEGLSITDIVKEIPLNRNTASRYLDTMLVSGQVEMRHFGMAKLYTLTRRLPISSVLSISSEYVMQIDSSMHIVFINTPFLQLLGLSEQDVAGKKIEFTPFPHIFEEEYDKLLLWISLGLSKAESRGEISLATLQRTLVCRVSPAVFADGKKGVSVLCEDITQQREDERRLMESEEKFRRLVGASADGILVADPEGCVMVWNNALTRITGVPEEEALGKPVTDILGRCIMPARGERENIIATLTRLISAIRAGSSRHPVTPIEMTILHSDGSSRVIQQSHFPIRTSGGTLIGFIVHDITERRQMLDEIQAREERFRTLFNNAADMISVHGFTREGMPGNFIEVNDVGCRRLGYTHAEFLELSPRDLLDPSCLSQMQKHARDLMTQGSAVFEMIHVAKDGSRIPVEIRSHIFEYRGEKLVIGQVRDLSAEKRAEAAIKESEDRLQTALDGADTGLWEMEIPSLVVKSDERAAHILGLNKEDLGSGLDDWKALSHPEDVPLIEQRIADCLEGRSAGFETEHRMRHASGRWIWISGRGKVTRRAPDGTPLRLSGVLHDVTRRKEAEDALRRSEEHLKGIIRTAPIGIGIVAGRVLHEVNDQMCEMTGYTEEELVGHPVRLLYTTTEEYDRVDTEVYSGIPAKGIGSIETFWARKDRQIIHVLLSLSPLTPADSTAGMVFTVLDITARKKTEDAIRESETRYRKLLEQSFDGVVIHRDGRVLQVNERAEQLLGASSPDQLIGHSISEFIHPRYLKIVENRLRNLQGKIDRNLPLMHQVYLRVDKRPLDVEVMSVIFPEDGLPTVRTVFRDITHRVTLERTLIESEELYRNLAESATDMIYLTNPTGDLLYANTLCARMFGCTQEDLVGRKQSDLFPPEIAEEHLARIREVVATKKPVDHIESIPTPSGSFRIDIRLSPILSPDGSVVSIVGIARDLTAREPPAPSGNR